jgi:hypothetical protein
MIYTNNFYGAKQKKHNGPNPKRSAV